MALIGTLRNKMGTWVVVFVFVAIAAFTLNDLLGNNSVLLGNNDVGEIAGTSISLEEYQAAVQEREANYQLMFNRAPGERERPLIHDQAWEMLVARHAIEKQYDELGIHVTSEEVEDMIWGKNVDQNLRATPVFLDEAGQFDKNRVIQYLQYVNQMPANSEERFRWETYQQNLAPARIRIKYENLLIKTTYVTRAEAEREYHAQNNVAEVKYLYVPFYAVSDSAVKVSDTDLRNYYNKNKEKYKTEKTAAISYVTFPVVPSAADTAAIRTEMQRLADGFRNAENDSVFALINSKAESPYARYTPNTLPPYVNPDSLVAGKVFGPFLDQNTFKVVKVSSAGKDTINTARARHILIKWENETPEAKEAARKEAEQVLQDLRGGADFAATSREVSDDPTAASRGGDLGFFSTGDMVAPFQEAVFSATKTGLINRLVETQFGYHIIDVTQLKDNTAYWIGVLEEEITPSDASINDALRQAETFQADAGNKTEFEQQAAELGLNILEANNIGTSERRIGILGDAREVVQWIFNTGSVGEVSPVFDLQDQFVVALMTAETDKGYKSLEQVKDEITPLVRNEMKGKIIIDRLSAMNGSLDEMANEFGNDANVYTNSDLRMNATSLPGIGFDPKALGTAFSLENGKRSAPFAGENGVIVMEMQNKTVAPEVADYSLYRNQLEQSTSNRTSFNIADAIKASADIEDNRYKYY